MPLDFTPRNPVVGTKHLAILVIALVFASPAAAQQGCLKPAEAEAVRVRVLQTELTVGALTCGWQSRYAGFVQRFEPALAVHAAQLRRYFDRLHGAAAEARLDDFITALANDMALYNVSSGRRICAALDGRLRALRSVEPGGLSGYVRRAQLPPLPVPQRCPDQAAEGKAEQPLSQQPG